MSVFFSNTTKNCLDYWPGSSGNPFFLSGALPPTPPVCFSCFDFCGLAPTKYPRWMPFPDECMVKKKAGLTPCFLHVFTNQIVNVPSFVLLLVQPFNQLQIELKGHHLLSDCAMLGAFQLCHVNRKINNTLLLMYSCL